VFFFLFFSVNFAIKLSMINNEYITQLQLENEQLKKVISTLEKSVNLLKEQLEWFKKQIFGKRSEKIIPSLSTQLTFEGMPSSESTEKAEAQPIKAHERQKSNRQGQDTISLPEDLPVEQVVLDLPEEQKVCQETGIELVKIGEEISRKLAHKPGSYYIKEIIRPKYAHPKRSEEGIKTANLPESLLNRCYADDSLLAEILVRKYADHLPLYRVSEILSRDNVEISRQLLSQWVLKSAEALRPLYNEMQRQILSSGYVFIDESPVKMLDPGAGQTKLTYMWVLCGGKGSSPPYRIYNFRDNRQHRNAEEILKGFSGVLHSDKYGAYENLAHRKQFTWCPCWVHIRRKFFEAEHGDKEFRQMILGRIEELFAIEKIAWEESPSHRLEIRQKDSVPIIDSLTLAVKEKLANGKVLPKSNFKEALGYYYSLIPFLKNYTSDPWAHLDNNLCERAVRPLAIGRKNWLFVGNQDGGDAAAIALSLIQTCRGLGINPRIYLEDVMQRIMSYNSQKLADLLPDNWLKEKSS
jgi:transposase